MTNLQSKIKFFLSMISITASGLINFNFWDLNHEKEKKKEVENRWWSYHRSVEINRIKNRESNNNFKIHIDSPNLTHHRTDQIIRRKCKSTLEIISFLLYLKDKWTRREIIIMIIIKAYKKCFVSMVLMYHLFTFSDKVDIFWNVTSDHLITVFIRIIICVII